jgi:hypothetical protein
MRERVLFFYGPPCVLRVCASRIGSTRSCQWSKAALVEHLDDWPPMVPLTVPPASPARAALPGFSFWLFATSRLSFHASPFRPVRRSPPDLESRGHSLSHAFGGVGMSCLRRSRVHSRLSSLCSLTKSVSVTCLDSVLTKTPGAWRFSAFPIWDFLFRPRILCATGVCRRYCPNACLLR